jgi:hypothetical protein
MPRAEVVGVGARSDTSSAQAAHTGLRTRGGGTINPAATAASSASLFMSSASTSTAPMQTSTWCSLVGVPPAVRFRRQIEAG